MSELHLAAAEMNGSSYDFVGSAEFEFYIGQDSSQYHLPELRDRQD